jgi:ABC-type phosphate transport system substrate-binding protein
MDSLMLLKILILVGGLSTTSFADSAEPLVVVVHKDNPTNELSRSQLIDLYMGKYVAFPDGRRAEPLDIDNDDQLKEQFYLELVGMPLNRVNAYWSRVKFSGNARPPLKQSNQQAALQYLAASDSAITYISASNVTNDVKVVYRFDE